MMKKDEPFLLPSPFSFPPHFFLSFSFAPAADRYLFVSLKQWQSHCLFFYPFLFPFSFLARNPLLVEWIHRKTAVLPPFPSFFFFFLFFREMKIGRVVSGSIEASERGRPMNVFSPFVLFPFFFFLFFSFFMQLVAAPTTVSSGKKGVPFFFHSCLLFLFFLFFSSFPFVWCAYQQGTWSKGEKDNQVDHVSASLFFLPLFLLSLYVLLTDAAREVEKEPPFSPLSFFFPSFQRMDKRVDERNASLLLLPLFFFFSFFGMLGRRGI